MENHYYTNGCLSFITIYNKAVRIILGPNRYYTKHYIALPIYIFNNFFFFLIIKCLEVLANCRVCGRNWQIRHVEN